MNPALLILGILNLPPTPKELFDAPLIPGARYRFPSVEVCKAASALNRDHARYLDDRIRFAMLFNQDLAGLLNQRQETQELWLVWDWLYYAQMNPDYDGYWRELRRCIGYQAYAAGQMPPPVPLWRFRPIR